MTGIRFGGLLGLAFMLGYACAQTSTEKAITQAHGDLDANAAQISKQIVALHEELKKSATGTNIDLNQADQVQQQTAASMRVAVVGLETSVARTVAAILEKTVYANNIENEAHGRLIEFFGVEAGSLRELREKGVTIGSLVVGLGISKAKQLKPETVFQQYLQKKSWAEIARAEKLQPEELTRALQGLVPNN